MLRILILSFILSSCSLNAFKKKQPKKSELDARAQVNDYQREVKSWADSYYTDTTLKVTNPLIKENAKEVFKICQGKDIAYSTGYDSRQLTPIKFKKTPLTIYTKDGFKMKSFVTKGICREIALLKSQLEDNEKSFRKSIESISLKYVYNGNVFATSMVLNTQFKSVIFNIQ